MNQNKNSDSVVVNKTIPVSFDLRRLSVFDENPLDISDDLENYLISLTRDNTQLLINELLSCPVKVVTDSHESSNQTSSITTLILPNPTFHLPREKHLPQSKPLTKWQEFAKKKGIRPKTKEGKIIFDKEAQEWKPKWGYKGVNKKLDDQWLVEVDQKQNDSENKLLDPRTLNRKERKKLVKKNYLQKKKNLEKSAA